MTIPITLPISAIQHQAITSYAEMHRIPFNQALSILLTIGLETSLANSQAILSAAHNRAIVDQPFGP